MNRIVLLLLTVFLLFSCKKNEDHNIIWEKSFGNGQAFFVGQTSDSALICCGTLSGKPFIIRYASGMVAEAEYTSLSYGSFTSAWWCSDCFIAAGSSEGKMLVERIDPNGIHVWDTTISTDFEIEKTSLIHEGNGNFLAVGTGKADSFDNNESGIFFVRIDTSGNIISETVINGSGFLSAGQACSDQSGNIYIPLTVMAEGVKPKATVARFSSALNKIWETELYNNPDYSATCQAVVTDGSGMLFVTGDMEASNSSGVLKNSFLASCAANGEILWKRYPENSNSGADLLWREGEPLTMLNRNCFIIRKVNPDDGSDAGTIRMFSQCDSYTTDAFGTCLTDDSNGNFVCAGSMGGNFYIAVKSSQ
ncbi:MAG TPA: hypothetical protein PLV06_08805 [Bacteroidales bacterium]|nr:hypothetical protein [Bacteroidales bacterium]HPF03172.1 hypothetical protein [Bacteroidales bacterium]HPJ58124.1 hypothetical protein [Bacteroidales bacterium]HPR12469.1 hypothetical protein [Bacteroidales bacterium]HRW84534.1 hypothetical protein [Bacteroidales bacterium]